MRETLRREIPPSNGARDIAKTFLEIRDPEVRLNFVAGISEYERQEAKSLYQTDVQFQIDVTKMVKDCCYHQWGQVGYEIAKDIGEAMGMPIEQIDLIIDQSREMPLAA